MSVKISVMLLLASMLATADALQCYACADLLCSTTSATTCPAPADHCVKAVHDMTSIVLKSCGVANMCNSKEPGLTTYCCKGNLCNSVGAVGKNLLLLLVPMASIFVLS
ncbi:hypothetical protein ACEWY4_024276 [Coilia grayii]|uniref:UPAR/Ly6 domain-containing protein n=1 Tax=Coilia grayii TaxID=363190 RepID=A0ABD1IZW9_9TELE